MQAVLGAAQHSSNSADENKTAGSSVAYMPAHLPYIASLTPRQVLLPDMTPLAPVLVVTVRRSRCGHSHGSRDKSRRLSALMKSKAC